MIALAVLGGFVCGGLSTAWALALTVVLGAQKRDDASR